MRKWRRFAASLLIGAMVWGATANFALAQEPAVTVTVVTAQVFQDVPSGHWAEKDIAKMKAKGIVAGVEPGKYMPNEPVNREQLVVMLMRVMDYAKDSWGTPMPSTFRNPEKVSDWAKSQIAYAINKGIVAGSDLDNFRPTEPATRLEAAVFLVRAMGLTEEANRRAGAVLNFTDARDIPSWAAGYVAIAQEKGLMSGNSDGTYKPMGVVTRAQMASILSRLDSQVKKLTQQEVRGIVFSVSPGDRSVIVSVSGGASVTLPLTADAVVYKDGKKISYTQLQRDDKVVAVINNQGHAGYLEVMDDSTFVFERVAVAGTIKSLILGSLSTLSITKEDGATAVYTFDASVKVYIEENLAAVSDLATGQEVLLQVEGTKVVQIAILDLERTLEGTIKEVNKTSTGVTVTVKHAQNREATYSLVQSTKILLDYKEAKVDDLFPGQTVELMFKGNKLENVLATSLEWELNAKVVGVSFAPVEAIKVEKEDGTQEIYPVASNARIRKGSKTITLRDLRPGDAVEMEMKNAYALRIYAEEEQTEVEGRVQAVIISTTPKITVVTSDGKEATYNVAADAKITQKSRRINVSAIQVGSWVVAELSGGYVVEMDVQARTVMDYVIGTIDNLNTSANVLVIRQHNSDGLKEVYLQSGADIIKFGDAIRVRDLQIGDEVITVGRVESGIFMASTVVVVAAADE